MSTNVSSQPSPPFEFTVELLLVCVVAVLCVLCALCRLPRGCCCVRRDENDVAEESSVSSRTGVFLKEYDA